MIQGIYDKTSIISFSVYGNDFLQYFYLQKMKLHKKLSIIETKIKAKKKISIYDEITLILVVLATKDRFKEITLKRVCSILDEIDYIESSRRQVIDSLIAFQIENFVKSKKEKHELNKVVNMQIPVEELFLKVEREYQYDQGFEDGFDKGKDDMIINMLDESFDLDTIQSVAKCSREHILKLREKHLASK